MPQLKAGAAKSNTSPALGVSLNGGFQDRTAAYIHDELHARCLVLDDGEKRIALVVCDACMIPTDLCEAAKHLAHENTGLPIDRILISATHTHSAPTLAGTFQSEPDEEYREFLVLRIADGIRRAIHNLQPAKIAWGAIDEPSQVFNRRWRMKPGSVPADPFGSNHDTVRMNPPVASADLLEPSGPIDPQIAVLAVNHAEGKPLALLANYSLHYVGDVGPGHVSADYFAAFADRIQQLLGADRYDPPFVGIMSNGTSGNINNINFREAAAGGPPYSKIRHVAGVVADRVHELYRRLEFRDTVKLDSRESRLTLGRRLPTKDETARARFILSQTKDPVLATAEQVYARETVMMEKLPPTEQVIVQALRMGDLGIAAIPCETFVETGLAIKAECPVKPTFTISLANGYAGYLPTPEHHQLGGYETWRARSSFLAVDAEPQVRSAVLELLKSLA